MNNKNLIENKAIYMRGKSDQALEQCFQRCQKDPNDFKSPSNRQMNCVEYCSIKLTNAYGYAFDVVQNGGIARAPESELKMKVLK